MNYTYFVVPLEDFHKSLLDECEQELKTIRTNHAGTHGILKTINPSSAEFESYTPMTHSEALDLMLTEDWVEQDESNFLHSMWNAIKNWFA
jgi:hypothetical protein